jgi:hypothetical protein
MLSDMRLASKHGLEDGTQPVFAIHDRDGILRHHDADKSLLANPAVRWQNESNLQRYDHQRSPLLMDRLGF